MPSNLYLTDGYQIVNDFISSKTSHNLSSEIYRFSVLKNKGGIRNAEKHFNSVKALTQSQYILDFASQ